MTLHVFRGGGLDNNGILRRVKQYGFILMSTYFLRPKKSQCTSRDHAVILKCNQSDLPWQYLEQNRTELAGVWNRKCPAVMLLNVQKMKQSKTSVLVR